MMMSIVWKENKPRENNTSYLEAKKVTKTTLSDTLIEPKAKSCSKHHPHCSHRFPALHLFIISVQTAAKAGKLIADLAQCQAQFDCPLSKSRASLHWQVAQCDWSGSLEWNGRYTAAEGQPVHTLGILLQAVSHLDSTQDIEWIPSTWFSKGTCSLCAPRPLHSHWERKYSKQDRIFASWSVISTFLICTKLLIQTHLGIT